MAIWVATRSTSSHAEGALLLFWRANFRGMPRREERKNCRDRYQSDPQDAGRRRYVGEEPFSHTTSLYNEALAEVLPKAGIELAVIPRAQAQGEAISASHVRQLIHDGQIEAIRPLVPETTYAYLTSDAGQNAVKRIQASDDVIHH